MVAQSGVAALAKAGQGPGAWAGPAAPRTGPGSGDGGEARTVTLLPDPEPRPIRVPVISVDDHLIEPADLFEGRMPAAMADGRRESSSSTTASRRGSTKGTSTRTSGSTLWSDRPREDWSMDPARFSRDAARLLRHPRAGRGHGPERGLGVAVLPVARRRILRVGLLEVVRTRSSGSPACAPGTTGTQTSGPARIRSESSPLQLPWLADIDLAAAEVLRNAERGFRAVSFPEFPVASRASFDLLGHVGPVLRRVRRDRDRRLPARRRVGMGAAPVARIRRSSSSRRSSL